MFAPHSYASSSKAKESAKKTIPDESLSSSKLLASGAQARASRSKSPPVCKQSTGVASKWVDKINTKNNDSVGPSWKTKGTTPKAATATAAAAPSWKKPESQSSNRDTKAAPSGKKAAANSSSSESSAAVVPSWKEKLNSDIAEGPALKSRKKPETKPDESSSTIPSWKKPEAKTNESYPVPTSWKKPEAKTTETSTAPNWKKSEAKTTDSSAPPSWKKPEANDSSSKSSWKKPETKTTTDDAAEAAPTKKWEKPEPKGGSDHDNIASDPKPDAKTNSTPSEKKLETKTTTDDADEAAPTKKWKKSEPKIEDNKEDTISSVPTKMWKNPETKVEDSKEQPAITVPAKKWKKPEPVQTEDEDKEEDNDVIKEEVMSQAARAREMFAAASAAAAKKSSEGKPVPRWKRQVRQSSCVDVKQKFSLQFVPKSPSSTNVFKQWTVPSLPEGGGDVPGAPPLLEEDDAKKKSSVPTWKQNAPKLPMLTRNEPPLVKKWGKPAPAPTTTTSNELAPSEPSTPKKVDPPKIDLLSPTPTTSTPLQTSPPASALLSTPTSVDDPRPKAQTRRRSSSLTSPSSERPKISQKKTRSFKAQPVETSGPPTRELRVDGHPMTHWDKSNFDKKRDSRAKVIYEPKGGNEHFYKKWLDEEEYNILRETRIEQPYFSKYCRFFPKSGHFCCKACGNPLYCYNAKFNAENGWPAFGMCVLRSLEISNETALGDDVLEIHCTRCLSHIGNVVEEKNSTGTRGVIFTERHRVNGRALKYVEGNLPKHVQTDQLLLGPPKEEEPKYFFR